MTQMESLLAEFQMEAKITRNMLERIPDDKFDYKPHDKSFSMGKLAGHIAEIPGWVEVSIEADELDFATFKYIPPDVKNKEELLAFFDKCIADASEVFKRNSDERLSENWTMRQGETVYFSTNKAGVIRAFVLSHLIHHRGQLSVYMRINDIPLPSVYGPTADEQM